MIDLDDVITVTLHHFDCFVFKFFLFTVIY